MGEELYLQIELLTRFLLFYFLYFLYSLYSLPVDSLFTFRCNIFKYGSISLLVF